MTTDPMVSGTPYVSYIGEYGINVAKLVDTTWVTEALETERGSGFRTCLEYDGTNLHMDYNFNGILKYATRDISGTGPAWG